MPDKVFVLDDGICHFWHCVLDEEARSSVVRGGASAIKKTENLPAVKTDVNLVLRAKKIRSKRCGERNRKCGSCAETDVNLVLSEKALAHAKN